MNRRDRRAAASRRRRSADTPLANDERPADDPVLRGIEGARSDQRAATLNLFAQGQTAESVVRTCARAHVYALKLSEAMLRHEHRIVCKEGCSWCCHLRVSSTPLEVLGIAEWLKSELAGEPLRGVRDRALALAKETAGLTGDQRTPRPCPLLGDDRCLAYKVRPLTCRGWNSFDAGPCRAYVEGQADAAVEVHDRAILLSQAILGGIEDAVRERELDASTVDFAVALSIALEEPDAMTRWLAGEPLFQPARIAANDRAGPRRLKVIG